MLRVFTGDMKEIVFQGAIDPHTPVAQGWLRASHRKLDKKLSLPYRPYHTHDEKQPLKKGQPVDLDIEIWPTCIVVPAGYRIGLSVRGKDYEYGGGSGGKLSNFKNELTGCGPFLHDDPRDRPAAVFDNTTTLHFGSGENALSAAADHSAETAGTRQKNRQQESQAPLTHGPCNRRLSANAAKCRLRPFRGFTPTVSRVSLPA